MRLSLLHSGCSTFWCSCSCPLNCSGRHRSFSTTSFHTLNVSTPRGPGESLTSRWFLHEMVLWHVMHAWVGQQSSTTAAFCRPLLSCKLVLSCTCHAWHHNSNEHPGCDEVSRLCKRLPLALSTDNILQLPIVLKFTSTCMPSKEMLRTSRACLVLSSFT